MEQPIEHVAELRDHWWWRPGWRPGRHFYACHFTFDDQPAVQELVAAYQQQLRQVDGLDLIPRRWLHLTMQGIGFMDQVTPDQAREIVLRAEDALRRIQPPEVTFHSAVVRPEAILLPASPSDQIIQIRSSVRQAIKKVIDLELDAPAGYRPHVSVAYSNSSQDTSAVIPALARAANVAAVTVSLAHVELLEFHRDQRMYEWVNPTPIRIGEA